MCKGFRSQHIAFKECCILRSEPLIDSGFILPLAMLFLLILSFFILGVIEAGLLEIKMQGFYRDKIRSFYLAEKKLLSVEKEILGGSVSNKKHIKINHLDSNVCGVVFYRINVGAEYNGAKTYLESVFAKVDEDVSNCEFKPDKNVEGRRSFIFY